MADVEEGDIVLRMLPNGKEERNRVTKATFLNVGAAGLGPHYQIKYEKGSSNMGKPPVQNINITGAQSVQVGDHNTQNIVNSIEALVQKIESSSSSPEEKQEAKHLLGQFLAHPLTASILGGATGGLIS